MKLWEQPGPTSELQTWTKAFFTAWPQRWSSVTPTTWITSLPSLSFYPFIYLFIHIKDVTHNIWTQRWQRCSWDHSLRLVDKLNTWLQGKKTPTPSIEKKEMYLTRKVLINSYRECSIRAFLSWIYFLKAKVPMQLKDKIWSHCGYQCWPEWLKNKVFFQQEKMYKLSQSFSLPNEGVAHMKWLIVVYVLCEMDKLHVFNKLHPLNVTSSPSRKWERNHTTYDMS